MKKQVLASVWLILSLILAGCVREEITAEKIAAKMQESQRNTNDLHAIFQIDFSSPEDTGSLKAEFWIRKTGMKDGAGNDICAFRGKVFESSLSDIVGTEAVFDGDQGWIYSSKENTAYVGSRADIEAHKSERAKNGPTNQAEMLLQLQDFLQRGLDALNIEILGQERIGGNNTYKLKLTPKRESQQQLQLPIELLVETTLWIDSTRWMPLKLLVDAKDMGKVEIKAQTLDLNVGVDVAKFKAKPPAGATIVKLADILKERNHTKSSSTTLEKAKAQAGFPVLTATDAANTSLVDVQMIKSPRGTTVVQIFSGPDIEWSLAQSQGNETANQAHQDGRQVDVRGTKGTLIEGKGNVGTLLIWKENEVTFVLAGNIPADQAQQIAADLK